MIRPTAAVRAGIIALTLLLLTSDKVCSQSSIVRNLDRKIRRALEVRRVETADDTLGIRRDSTGGGTGLPITYEAASESVHVDVSQLIDLLSRRQPDGHRK